MKEKIKIGLFGVFVFYVLVVLALVVICYFRINQKLEFSESETFTEELNGYKHELSLMEDNQCNRVINNIVKKYEDTNFNGEISYIDFYNAVINLDLLSELGNVREACGLSQEEIDERNLTYLFLNTAMQYDWFVYHNYELSLRDDYIISYSEYSSLRYNYILHRQGMLEIIENLIEISKEDSVLQEGVVINEE